MGFLSLTLELEPESYILHNIESYLLLGMKYIGSWNQMPTDVTLCKRDLLLNH